MENIRCSARAEFRVDEHSGRVLELGHEPRRSLAVVDGDECVHDDRARTRRSQVNLICVDFERLGQALAELLAHDRVEVPELHFGQRQRARDAVRHGRRRRHATVARGAAFVTLVGLLRARHERERLVDRRSCQALISRARCWLLLCWLRNSTHRRDGFDRRASEELRCLCMLGERVRRQLAARTVARSHFKFSGGVD